MKEAIIIYRIYPKNWVISKNKTIKTINMKGEYFSDLIIELFGPFNGNAFFVTDKFCTQVHHLKIDYASGDIYFPVQMADIEENHEIDLSNMGREWEVYIERLGMRLLNVINAHTKNHYIFKKGLKENNLYIYYPKTDEYICYELTGILFEKNVTSELLIESLLIRDLANKRTRVSNLKGIKFSSKFLELQSMLGNKVMRDNYDYIPYRNLVPKIENSILRQYEEIEEDKNMASILLSLRIYSLIYNNIDITLHDGTKLKFRLNYGNYYFFKVKNEIYYIILKREWFRWGNKSEDVREKIIGF